MSNLTSVTLTAGVPTVGTGDVSTIDALMADGGMATIGAKANAASTATDTTAVTAMSVWKQISKTLQAAAGAVATAFFAKITDGTNTAAVKAASTAAAATDPALVVTLSPNGVNANGQATMAGSAPVVLPTDQTWKTGMSNKAFVAAFTTLTRPANTTAYTAADSISDNATAGSVSALSATVSDTNDDPIFISDVLVTSTDTGLAGKRIRAYLFNSDPTASTGVGGGDNAAYSQKKAGYIGSFSGVLESGFSDGTVGRLVPSYNDGAAASTPNAAAGGFLCVKPTSGARTLYIQYQAVDGFTPSANSTTIIGSVRGWQARAA